MKRFNAKGEEVPDTTPVELPVGFRHPPSLQEEIRRMVEVNLSRAAERAGDESLEEASDFDVPDEAELVVSNLQVQTMEDDAIMAHDAEMAQRLVEERSQSGERASVEVERRRTSVVADVGEGERNRDEEGDRQDSGREGKGSSGRRDSGDGKARRKA